MPFYTVLIEGKNLRIPGSRESPPIVGFFTTRVVYAATRAVAEAKALESVRLEWRKPAYSNQPGTQRLSLTISQVKESGLLQWLRAPNKGHTFFSEEPKSEA